MDDPATNADARFKALFSFLPKAIGFSRDGIMLDANPAYLRLFGYDSIDELRGTSILQQIAPQCQADIQERIRKRASGETLDDVYETIGVRRDGSQFPFLISVTRVQLEEGPVTLVAIDDLTDLRGAQARLNDALDFQERLVAASPIGILAYSADGQCVTANGAAARIVGATPEELMEQNFRR